VLPVWRKGRDWSRHLIRSEVVEDAWIKKAGDSGLIERRERIGGDMLCVLATTKYSR
jgi:hypothetical protein